MQLENETNVERLYHVPNPSPYVKDGINDAVVNGLHDRVNVQQGSNLQGTPKRWSHQVGASRWIKAMAAPQDDPFADFDAIFTRHIAEAETGRISGRASRPTHR